MSLLIKNISSIVILILLIVVLINVFLKIYNFKLAKLREDMIENYYDQKKLNQVLTDSLKGNKTGEINKDFNSFVKKIMSKQLKEMEEFNY